jgi:DNA-binding CsgD family transcriptional regulator
LIDRCSLSGGVALEPVVAKLLRSLGRALALNILDQLSVGVVLLDRSANIVFANAAARAVSEESGSLDLNCRVTSPSSVHARRLGALIQSVLGGTIARTMSLPTGSGRPLMVLASPVRDEANERSDIPNQRVTAAILLICDPDRPAQISPAWMMDAYGLTSAEVRVATSIASGVTISETARRLQVSVNTVKTHLRHVYGKTGTRRQAELCRMVATIGLIRGDEPQMKCAAHPREARGLGGRTAMPIRVRAYGSDLRTKARVP